jgi:predicted GH43/DUF377 family glycosyl hydrolase
MIDTQAAAAAVVDYIARTGRGKKLLVKLVGAEDAARRLGNLPAGSVTPTVAGTARCRWEGPVVEYAACGSEYKHVRMCLYEGWDVDRCTRGRTGQQSCQGCKHFTRGPVVGVATVGRTATASYPAALRYDETNLWPDVPGKRFNPSIIEWRGGYLIAARHGWEGCDIYLGRLDHDLRPVGDPVRLPLWHREANYGREDPRLFVHNGALHVAFIGVVGGGRRVSHTNQMYARLTDDLRLDDVFAPVYRDRKPWEKNWQFFSAGGDLYAVYSVTPYVVLRVDGHRTEVAFRHPSAFPWQGGEVRGGAAPVRVGGEWWSFFHDRVDAVTGKRVYRAGLYTFAADPPFAPLRYIPSPILTADLRQKPPDQYAHVIWPGGAVRRENAWTLACGIHDRWTELVSVSHDFLESSLVAVR